MTWTREHDRILAEKCEGFKVRRWDELPIAQQHYDYCPDNLFIGESIHSRLANYNTDIAACIRAAEGWRLQKPDREYRTRSKHNDEPALAQLFEQGIYVTSQRGDHALAECLYEAVTNA